MTAPTHTHMTSWSTFARRTNDAHCMSCIRWHTPTLNFFLLSYAPGSLPSRVHLRCIPLSSVSSFSMISQAKSSLKSQRQPKPEHTICAFLWSTHTCTRWKTSAASESFDLRTFSIFSATAAVFLHFVCNCNSLYSYSFLDCISCDLVYVHKSVCPCVCVCPSVCVCGAFFRFHTHSAHSSFWFIFNLVGDHTFGAKNWKLLFRTILIECNMDDTRAAWNVKLWTKQYTSRFLAKRKWKFYMLPTRFLIVQSIFAFCHCRRMCNKLDTVAHTTAYAHHPLHAEPHTIPN